MRRLFLLLLICWCALSSSSATRISQTFRNVSMSEALRSLALMADDYTINFIFDDLEDFMVTTEIQDKTLVESIMQVAGFYPIRITINNDTRIISVECYQRSAQRYKGVIVDEQGQPIPLVNIALLNPQDSTYLNGGVSNESGVFVIPCETNPVLARISHLGRQTVYAMLTPGSSGTIRLSMEAIPLDNVSISGATLPRFQPTASGLWINVENTLLSQMGTASDVLGQLPLVSMHQGQIRVFAKGIPDIYVNNRLLTSNMELDELKSEDLKAVELITNPGVRYHAQSVIRILTRSNVFRGLNLRNDAQVRNNSEWQGSDQLRLMFNTGRFEVTNLIEGDLSVVKDEGQIFASVYRGDSLNSIRQETQSFLRNKNLSEKLMMNYSINDSSSIGASYWYYRNYTKPTIRTNWNELNTPDEHREYSSEDRHTVTFLPRQELNFYYTGKFGKWNIDLNATYLYQKQGEDFVSLGEDWEYLWGRTFYTCGSELRNKMYAVQLDVSRPVGKGYLLLGMEYLRTNVTTRNVYIREENKVGIREKALEAYCQYSRPLGHYELSAGLRVGQMWEDNRETRLLLPDLSLSWQRDELFWQLYYHLKYHRPDYVKLKSFLYFTNRCLNEGGNRNLRSEEIHNVEASGRYKWLTLSAGINHITSPMIRCLTLLDHSPYEYLKDYQPMHLNSSNNYQVHIESGMSILTTQNFDQQDQLYLSLSAAPRFGCYQPIYEVDFYRQYFAEADNQPLVALTLNNQFRITPTLTAAANLRFESDYQDGFVSYRRRFFASGSLRKTFCSDKLILQLQVSDLGREQWRMECANSVIEKDLSHFTLQGMLTVTYMLNMYEGKYRGKGAGQEERERVLAY